MMVLEAPDWHGLEAQHDAEREIHKGESAADQNHELQLSVTLNT